MENTIRYVVVGITATELYYCYPLQCRYEFQTLSAPQVCVTSGAPDLTPLGFQRLSSKGQINLNIAHSTHPSSSVPVTALLLTPSNLNFTLLLSRSFFFSDHLYPLSLYNLHIVSLFVFCRTLLIKLYEDETDINKAKDRQANRQVANVERRKDTERNDYIS